MTDTLNDNDEYVWIYDEDESKPNCYEEHRLNNNLTWMLKDKTIVDIKCMSTKHIKNSMAMLERIHWENCSAYQGLDKELQKRLKVGEAWLKEEEKRITKTERYEDRIKTKQEEQERFNFERDCGGKE